MRRVVEFLNEQMDPAEVLAIGIKRYAGEEIKALVPRLIGAKIGPRVGRSESRQWDEISFFKELSGNVGDETVEVARRILTWAGGNNLRIWWGKGNKDGAFYMVLDHKGVRHSIVSVWTYGRVEIQFQWMQSRPPFDSEVKRRELLDRLNEAGEFHLPDDSIARRPPIPLMALRDEAVAKRFLERLEWFINEVRRS